MRFVIAVYVENTYGVLARVSGLFMRRGYNIDSLTVGETDDPNFSRITITLDGDNHLCEQIINQLYKLHNVKKVKLLGGGSSVERELMLIKVKIKLQWKPLLMMSGRAHMQWYMNRQLQKIVIHIVM